MARPKADISAEQVQALAEAQLTNAEIARVCGTHVRTVERRFAAAIKEWRELGTGSARRKLYTMGMAGNTACLIFFLKNYGGMADVSRSERSVDFGLLDIPFAAESRPVNKPN